MQVIGDGKHMFCTMHHWHHFNELCALAIILLCDDVQRQNSFSSHLII